jgi:hypothetical protein
MKIFERLIISLQFILILLNIYIYLFRFRPVKPATLTRTDDGEATRRRPGGVMAGCRSEIGALEEGKIKIWTFCRRSVVGTRGFFFMLSISKVLSCISCLVVVFKNDDLMLTSICLNINVDNFLTV